MRLHPFKAAGPVGLCACGNLEVSAAHPHPYTFGHEFGRCACGYAAAHPIHADEDDEVAEGVAQAWHGGGGSD